MNNAIVALLLASCIFASAHVAKDHDKDKEKKEKEEHWHEHREMDLHYGKDWISFESEIKNKSARTKDKVEFDLRNEGASPMRFKYEYKHEAGDAESELKVRVVYTSLVEYAEATGVFDGYDEKDTVVQKVDFSTRSWLPIAKPTTEQIDGGLKYTFDVKYATGVVAMKVYFASAPFSAGGWAFTPVQVKVDIIVQNFPYKRNDTFLALVCMVKGNNDIEREHHHHHGEDDAADDEEQERIVAVDTAFAFGWNRTVEADGVAASVVATDFAPTFMPVVVKGRLGDDDGSGSDDDKGVHYWKQTYYSFSARNAKKLVWDPYLGVESNGAASLFASFAALLLALAALL